MDGTADATKTVGDISQAVGWTEGSAPKVILHGVVGAATAKLGGGSPGVGAAVGAANELALPTFDQLAKNAGLKPGSAGHEALVRLSSFGLGSVVGNLVGGGDMALVGAGIAGSATDNNYLSHQDAVDMQTEIKKCKTDKDCIGKVLDKYEKRTGQQTNGYIFDKCKSAGAAVKACVERQLKDAKVAQEELLNVNSKFWQQLSPQERLLIAPRLQNGTIGHVQNAMFADPLGNGNSDFNGMVRNCLNQGATSWASCIKIDTAETGGSLAMELVPGGLAMGAG